jgi:iron complex transport system substrate-binding protein
MLRNVKVIILTAAVLFIAVFLVLFSGCKVVAPESNSGEQLSAGIEVVDGEQNTIKLPETAESAVVLSPSALETIDGLGAMDLVVEVDSFSVMMGEPLAAGFEGVGDYQTLNIERIIELDPDIIIAIPGGPEDDYAKIKDLGIEVYRVIDVSGIEGVYEEITNISKIFGLEEEGQVLVDKLRSEVEDIYNEVKDLSADERPGVFYEVWNDPLMSAGQDTFINALIEIAGGVNILAEDGLTGWPEYSAETLVMRNPEVIIAPMSLAVDPSVIKEDSRFLSIDAVINDRVYIVPDNPVSRPSHNVIKGLKMFAMAIHPESFGEFEILE